MNGMAIVKNSVNSVNSISMQIYEESLASLRENTDSSPSLISLQAIYEKPSESMKFVNWKEELDGQFICVYCKSCLIDPCRISCNHWACLACMEKIKENTPSEQPMKCPLCLAKITGKKLVVDTVLQTTINQLEVYCTYAPNGCQWNGILEELKSHLDTCNVAVIECNRGCGAKYFRRNKIDHASECPEMTTTCEFCHSLLKKNDEIDHLYKCPDFKIPCQNNCGATEIKRSEMINHLENNCSRHHIKCPFSESGCKFTSLRTEMGHHIKESSGLHLNLVNAIMVLQMKQLQALADIINEQNEKLTHTIEKAELCEKFFGSTFIWKITEYAEKLNESKSGKVNTIFSSPFFTSRHGYKLVLSASLFGDGNAKGKFMSVYVCVCKGEYDPLLAWPFVHRTVLTLIDQQEIQAQARSIQHVIKPNNCKENMSFLGRPNADRNTPFGVQKFISLDALKSHKYILDNAIFIKCEVDHEKMKVV